MEVTSKEIIEREIESWINNRSYYSEYFKQKHTRMYIWICEYITEPYPFKDKLITDFMAGLIARYKFYKTKKDLYGMRYDMLTKPVFDLLKEKVQSDEFRLNLIEKEITGDATLNAGGVSIPISKGEILLHIGRTKKFPLVPKEIQAIEKDLINYKRMQYSLIPNLQEEEIETKTERLKSSLNKYGFFDLILVKSLSPENKEKLVELLILNGFPYCIAMFDYLGYLQHLQKEYFQTKYKLYPEISSWFNLDKSGRNVKGNISSLLKKSTEDKRRYTAHLHKETVQKDYQKLK